MLARRRPPWIRTATLVVAVFLPAAAGGQEPEPPAPEGELHPFAGFAGVPWGAPRDSVVARHGEPGEVRDLSDRSAVSLVYTEVPPVERSGAAGFLVHESEGLIRGQLLIPYGQGEDCWQLYTLWRERLDTALPEVQMQEQVTRGPEDLDFCTAFQLGQASAAAEWWDPDSDALVAVGLDLSAGVLRVSYESPAFARISASEEESGSERR